MKAGVVEFLLARFAEREADLRSPDVPGSAGATHGRLPVVTYFDKGHELAEVEAKLRIVRALAADEGSGDTSEGGRGAHATKVRVCEILASVYADHPDYQQEWRP